MIAVLAAMLFIGIVTASMVKNTKSQSTASIGYGTMQIMSSTVRSGMIATETYFLTADSIKTLALITKSLNAKNPSDKKQFLLFNNNSGDGRKTRLGNSDQYFSSQLIDVQKKTDETAYGYFEIKSGRRDNGKGLKRAMAFYEMGGVKITNLDKYNPNNALYSNGEVAGDGGLNIYSKDPVKHKARVTFEKKVKFQNTKYTFEGDAYFHEGVNIATSQTPEFKDKVYFNDYLEIENAGNALLSFDNDVGINGNLSYIGNKTIQFKKDVWFNGDFKTPGGTMDKDLALKGNGNAVGNGSNNLYYSSSLSIKKSVTNCNISNICQGSNPCPPNYCYPNNSNCCVHNCRDHFVKQDSIVGFSDMNDTYKSSMDNIPGDPNKLNIGTLEERREQPLDIGNLKDENGKDNYSVSAAGKDWGANTIQTIRNLYNDPNTKLYNGEYLVISIPPNVSFNFEQNPANYNVASGTSKLLGGEGEKVIFVVEPGATFNVNRNFPPMETADDLSTMIYVSADDNGQKASINQFGIANNGTPESATEIFRGLIYIDPNNTSTNNSFYWRNGNKLVGAVHNFSKEKLGWNGVDGDPPEIEFDPEALDGFASLKGGDSSGKTTDYSDQSDRRIHLKAMGYYFF
jgi:hypothetical protein